MNKLLKKASMFLLSVALVISLIVNNTVISNAQTYSGAGVLLLQPYTDMSSRLCTIEPIVRKHYNRSTRVVNGSMKRNQIRNIKNLTGNKDIVVVFTHGTYDNKRKEGAFIVGEGGRLYAVYADNILRDSLFKVKKNSIYIIAACNVSKNHTNLAKALIKKGAKAVYSYNNITTVGSAEKQVDILLKNLKQGKTPKQAYNAAIKGGKNGLVFVQK